MYSILTEPDTKVSLNCTLNKKTGLKREACMGDTINQTELQSFGNTFAHDVSSVSFQ